MRREYQLKELNQEVRKSGTLFWSTYDEQKEGKKL